MSIDDARAFLRSHHHAILITRRADESLQTSPVVAGVDDAGRVMVSVTEDRAKTKNARRDPRVTLTAFVDEFYGPWVQVDGTATLISATEAEGMDGLIALYRQVSGEHPDWDEYRAAMLTDRRVLLQIDITRATP